MFAFFKRKDEGQLKRYKNLKVGLSLGGGATRGIAHIGAIRAFEEFGIKFDFVAGTSAGSLVGAFYAAGKTYEQMRQIALGIKEKDIRTSKILLIPSKTTGIEDLITHNLGDINIQDLPLPFAPVVVNIKSTEEIALRRGNLAKAVAGSCAVPGVFAPVDFEGKILVDGGLQNTIPADIPKLFGCDYVVAIDVNSTRAYGTDSTKLLDIMGASIRILMKSNAIKGYVYSEVMIKPNLKRFKSTSMEGIEEMIDEGYRATKEMIPQILEIFKRKPVKRKWRKEVFGISKNKTIENQYDIRLINKDEEKEFGDTNE